MIQLKLEEAFREVLNELNAWRASVCTAVPFRDQKLFLSPYALAFVRGVDSPQGYLKGLWNFQVLEGTHADAVDATVLEEKGL